MGSEIRRRLRWKSSTFSFLISSVIPSAPSDEQRALVNELNAVVRQTDEYQEADSAGQLIKIPTGDGMALVFYSNPEAPVECAFEISCALLTDWVRKSNRAIEREKASA